MQETWILSLGWEDPLKMVTASFNKVKKVKVTQPCPTLCNPMDYTFHGILQARIVEWVAIPFLLQIFPTQVSCIAGGFFIS